MNGKFFRFSLGLILGLFLSCVLARAEAKPSFSLELDPHGVSTSEIPALQNFLASVEQLLPEGLKDGIGRKIQVRFSKMGDAHSLEVPACMGVPETAAASDKAIKQTRKQKMELLGHDRLGGRASVVDLNALFKGEILSGPNTTHTYACGHRSMYRLAEATLIHELAHVYDASLGKNRSTKNRYFQHLMGFTEQWSWNAFLFRALQSKNRLPLRSPDPYEFKNIKESFAVNMEYFVLDPEFACRRPTVDGFYRDLLGVKSVPQCPLNTTIFQNSDNSALNLKNPVNLDPSRIYDVHYLFASKGDALMSRWGHGMFRLIVCAPDRKEVGPECLKDVQYHVVVSYRANVQDLVLSYGKGLLGGYPSQIFILPLSEIINEYNKLELRDLISLPLALQPEQKRDFVLRTIEQYWEYQGRYYFLTNNCATEAMNFLQGVVDDKRIQDLHNWTPLGLENDLIKSGFLNSSLLKDKTQSIADGYFFPSKRPILDDAFANIQEKVALLPVDKTDRYMNETSAEERLSWFTAAMHGTSGQEHTKLAAYFYLLESFISSRSEQDLGKSMTQALEKLNEQKNSTISTDLLQTVRGEQPWSRLSSGYGIPLTQDFDTSSADAHESQKAEMIKKLQDWMKVTFKEELEEFSRIDENKVTFRHEIGAPRAFFAPLPVLSY